MIAGVPRFVLRAALTAALAVAVCAPCVHGQPAPAAKTAKTLMALTAEEIDARRFLPPPPAEGSELHRRDLADLHSLIAARTPARLAQAKWDDDHENPSAFYATIGGGFDLKTLPATAALLAVVMNDQATAASAAKKAFPRLRPWASDKTIPTCDPDDKPLTSYPSGHATMGFTVGLVLATLIPEKAQALQVRAMDYALSREICGSHYPSDTQASHVLGTAIALELLSSPSLQSKITAAKAELRDAHFTQ